MNVAAAVLSPITPGLMVDEAQADQIGPGLLAFTIVVLLGIATFLLIRSMLHQIRKVPPTFDSETDEQQPDGRPPDSTIDQP